MTTALDQSSAEKLLEACIAFRADYRTHRERVEALYDAIGQMEDDDLLVAAPAMRELGSDLQEVFS